MKFPRMLDIRQNFPRAAPVQIEQVIKSQFEDWNRDIQLAGKRIAVGIGSRGISNIKDIAAAVLEQFREREIGRAHV